MYIARLGRDNMNDKIARNKNPESENIKQIFAPNKECNHCVIIGSKVIILRYEPLWMLG